MKPILPLSLILGTAALSPAAVGVSHIATPLTNEFVVFQTFDKSDYTGFAFTYISGSTYRFSGSYLDEGLDLYRVPLGSTFAPEMIAGGGFSEFTLNSNYNLPATFYVGLNTPSKNAGLATLPPAYGWVKIGNSGGVLSVLDHAIDYSGNGLIVGTTTVVPELPTTCLAAFGLTCLMAPRRRTVSRLTQQC